MPRVASKATFVARAATDRLANMILNDIFGSKGRVALLAALFDGRCRSIHIRELARSARLSAPSLMREAKAFVKAGLLNERRDGNRVDYSANSESPMYKPLVEIVKSANGAKDLLAQVFSDCDADAVFIYGSRASGNERADSDYDVFVVAVAGEAASKIGVEVNPYVLTPEEFGRRMRAGDHFLSNVMSSPKVFLKGSDDELARLV